MKKILMALVLVLATAGAAFANAGNAAHADSIRLRLGGPP
jgi:hypothetical protein